MKKRQSAHIAIYKIVKQELFEQEIEAQQFVKDLGFSKNFKRDLTSPKVTFERVAEIASYLSIDANRLVKAYLNEKRELKNEL